MGRSGDAPPCSLIVPTLDIVNGTMTASQAAMNAGMPCRVVIAVDSVRQGYTKTVNEALADVEGDAVILVDDCVTGPGWLAALREAVYARESLKVWFAGPSGPCRTWPQNNGRRGDKRRPKLVSHVAGFCIYARAEAVALGLDERFCHYASDVHWQRVARQKYGARSLWVPQVYVDHELHPPHQEWWDHDQALLAEIWS